MADDCDYCLQWNLEHSDEARRVSCGPCIVCQASGHLKAHPRQPTSICLCQKHWEELTSSAYHFELYHLIYVIILGIAAVQMYPLISRLWGS